MDLDFDDEPAAPAGIVGIIIIFLSSLLISFFTFNLMDDLAENNI